MILRFCSGSVTPLSATEENRRCVHDAEVDMEVFFVKSLHVNALVFAQEAVVDKNTGQLFADRLVQQRGGDRGIDPTGKTQQHTGLPHFGANPTHRVSDEITRRPILPGATNAEEKIADHIHAALGVEDLRMELDAVKSPLCILDAGIRRILRNSRGDKAWRESREFITVRIPNPKFARQTGKKLAGFRHRQMATAVFAGPAVGHPSTQKMPHQLHAVTDPEHRHTQFKNRGIRMRRGFRINALRPTRENDSDHTLLLKLRRRRRVVVDLGVNLTLPDTARDDLGELRAKIKDGDGLWHGGMKGGNQNSSIGNKGSSVPRFFSGCQCPAAHCGGSETKPIDKQPANHRAQASSGTF